ncbi:MAG: hypothetical protein QF521_21645, partial [Alphaproteobacteria bacterium]|nr:hypothetical protein [Alphaproteobacteria bacterium]
MRTILLLLLVLLPSFAGAAETEKAQQALAAAKGLNCVFDSAVDTTWEGESYSTRPQKGFSFTIDAINTARGNAKAVGRQGATHLEMIALPNVRHFLGFVATGDLNVTSVHAHFAGEAGKFLASHSVHMASEPPR